MNYLQYFKQNSQMTNGRQLAIALFINQIGLYNTRMLLKYIYEFKLIPHKDNHKHPDFIKYNKYFNDIFFVGRKMFDNL